MLCQKSKFYKTNRIVVLTFLFLIGTVFLTSLKSVAGQPIQFSPRAIKRAQELCLHLRKQDTVTAKDLSEGSHTWEYDAGDRTTVPFLAAKFLMSAQAKDGRDYGDIIEALLKPILEFKRSPVFGEAHQLLAEYHGFHNRGLIPDGPKDENGRVKLVEKARRIIFHTEESGQKPKPELMILAVKILVGQDTCHAIDGFDFKRNSVQAMHDLKAILAKIPQADPKLFESGAISLEEEKEEENEPNWFSPEWHAHQKKLQDHAEATRELTRKNAYKIAKVEKNLDVFISHIYWGERRHLSESELAQVEKLIRAGSPVDARNPDNDKTPLMLAAQRGDVGLFKLLVKHGADLRATYQESTRKSGTLSDLLDKKDPNSFEIAKALNSLHAVIGRRDFSESSKLASIAHVNELLVRGAPVNEPSSEATWGRTPLAIAAENNDVELFKLLLEKGGDPKSVSSASHEEIAYELAKAHRSIYALVDGVTRARTDKKLTQAQLALAEDLLKGGAHPDLRPEAGSFTALSQAAQNNDIALVKLLLNYGADVTLMKNQFQARYPGTKFSQEILEVLAVHSKSVGEFIPRVLKDGVLTAAQREVVRQILSSGGSVEDRASGSGYSPLMAAVSSGDSDLVKLLLEFKPALKNDHTSVEAVHRRAIDMPSIFKAKGANYSEIPLALAQASKSIRFLISNKKLAPIELEYVRTLLEQGALVDERRHEALRKGYYSEEEKLERFTPLMLAARNGDAALVELLLAHGADPKLPNVVDADGNVVANLASLAQPHPAILALLSQHSRVPHFPGQKSNH